MKNVSYKDQLADARWQQKKYEILNRDNFTCQSCGAKSHLNVHHLSYEKGRLAWEYPNERLITLCQSCHENEHYRQNANTMSDVKRGDWYYAWSGDFKNIGVVFDVNIEDKIVFVFGSNEGSWGCAHIYGVKYKDFYKNWNKLDIFEKTEEEESYAECGYFLSGITNAFDELMRGSVGVIGYEDDFAQSYAQHYMPIYVQRNDFLKDYCDMNNVKYEY